jgi:hypothetical protein
MHGSDFNWFVGKKIVSVTMNKDADVVDFVCEGASKRLGVYGECCSQSWIEHLTLPNDVRGATIQSVDEAEMPPHDNHKCLRARWDATDEQKAIAGMCDHDSLAVYHTRFRTDRGDIVLEYRNDSNGYYGGNLTDEGEVPGIHE